MLERVEPRGHGRGERGQPGAELVAELDHLGREVLQPGVGRPGTCELIQIIGMCETIHVLLACRGNGGRHRTKVSATSWLS